MSRLLTAVLALSPVMASAQAYEGAVVDLRYRHYEDNSGFDMNTIGGTLDASWMFGRVGLQAGLFLGKDIDSSDDIDLEHTSALALHLTTDVSDSLRLGAMASADGIADGTEFFAAEALYLAGPVRVEARLGDTFDNSTPYTLFEVMGSYALGNALTARAGMHYADFDEGGHYGTLSLGAGYKVSGQTEIYADLKHHNNDGGSLYGDAHGSVINLGVRFDLGGSTSAKTFSYMPLN
ncbi:porin [Tabrizicola sp. BL-A-41-H6]|uniref:porin n=1 Tax=Tabrizicola sp. BL-A-41-H6 TaxID=3421107 RepID=UPI003D66A24D